MTEDAPNSQFIGSGKVTVNSNADIAGTSTAGVKLATLTRGSDKEYTFEFVVDGKIGEIQPGTWSTTLNVIANAS